VVLSCPFDDGESRFSRSNTGYTSPILSHTLQIATTTMNKRQIMLHMLRIYVFEQNQEQYLNTYI